MAAKDAAINPTATNEDEWVTEQDESPDLLVFDTHGDEYVGLYMGQEVITYEDPKEGEKDFTQIKFWDAESPKAVNAGYRLLEAFRHIEIGREVRVRYVKDVPIKGQPSDMKDFKVWSRAPRAAWAEKAAEARKNAER